jgi:hypothetical protein
MRTLANYFERHGLKIKKIYCVFHDVPQLRRAAAEAAITGERVAATRASDGATDFVSVRLSGEHLEPGVLYELNPSRCDEITLPNSSKPSFVFFADPHPRVVDAEIVSADLARQHRAEGGRAYPCLTVGKGMMRSTDYILGVDA